MSNYFIKVYFIYEKITNTYQTHYIPGLRNHAYD